MDKRKASDRETLHEQMELLAERSRSESDYYKCGLLKWSKTPILSRVSLLVSAFALAVSLLARYKTG